MLAILADDEAMTRSAIAHLIKQNHNLDVLQAESAGDALQHCQERPPALVLMEVFMPGQDAFAAAGDIQRLWPSTRIGILTRHANPVLLQRAMKAKLQGFILKRDSSFRA